MMKMLIIGMGIFILGFIVVVLCTGVFSDSGDVEYSYYYAIIFSILYLCTIVGISTSLIINEIRKNKD